MIPSNQLYLNVVFSIIGDGIHTSWPVIKGNFISHLITAITEQHSTSWNEKPFRKESVLVRQVLFITKHAKYCSMIAINVGLSTFI